MECLLYFGITSMRDDTSAPLSGRGELHGGTKVLTLVAEKVYLIRFGIGFKKKNQFFPIILQKITDCSDYCPFK